MPAKSKAWYEDGRGRWYFKVTLGRDPADRQAGSDHPAWFRTAAEAGRAPQGRPGQVDTGQVRPSSNPLTVNVLLDLYLERTGFYCDQPESFVEPESWPVVGLPGHATVRRPQDDDGGHVDQSSARGEAVDIDAERHLVAG